MKRCFGLVFGFLLALLLGGCGSGVALTEVTLSSPTLDFATAGSTTLEYRVSAPATVSVWLEDAAGARYTLRDAVAREASSDPYQLTFDGSAAIDADTRRLLPDGAYTVVVQATPQGGAAVEQRIALTIINSPTTAFDVYDLKVTPNPFSPDEDAIDDEVKFSYRLPITATISIEIVEPGRGTRYPFITRAERGPGEQREQWSGRPVVGGVLPAGDYQYIFTAEDGRGNRVTKRATITLSSSGIGQLRLVASEIGPEKIERGGLITVTFTVENIGTIPIRTHGPPAGFTYTSRQTYASLEDGRYANKGGGLWRVGLDWEGNGGAGSRYPFRWALSPRPPAEWQQPYEFDVLKPGETATIVGQVQVLEIEDRMTFYVGIAHEGVDYPYDRYDPTLIRVN